MKEKRKRTRKEHLVYSSNPTKNEKNLSQKKNHETIKNYTFVQEKSF